MAKQTSQLTPVWAAKFEKYGHFQILHKKLKRLGNFEIFQEQYLSPHTNSRKNPNSQNYKFLQM
jgi:hypothetical protein